MSPATCTNRLPDNGDTFECGRPAVRGHRCAECLPDAIALARIDLAAGEQRAAAARERLRELEPPSGGQAKRLAEIEALLSEPAWAVKLWGDSATTARVEAALPHLAGELRAASEVLAAAGVPDDGRSLAERIAVQRAALLAVAGELHRLGGRADERPEDYLAGEVYRHAAEMLRGAIGAGEDEWGNGLRGRAVLEAEVARLEARLKAMGDTPGNGRQLICMTCSPRAWNVCTHVANRAQFGADREMEIREASAKLDALGFLAKGRDLAEQIEAMGEENENLKTALRCARGEHRKVGETMPGACADCGVDWGDLDCEDDTDPREGPMHTWFGLSHATHLVLPRVVIQSMPRRWQAELVALLQTSRVACEAAGIQVAERYYVRALDHAGRLVDEELPHYRRAPLLGDPAWDSAPRATIDDDDPVEIEVAERLKRRAPADENPEQERACHLANLRAALAFFEEWAADESYGAFPGGDPRLFAPDPEATTEPERAAHKAACEAWKRGERATFDVGPMNSETLIVKGGAVPPGTAFVHRPIFGLGTVRRVDAEMVRVRDGLRAALPAPPRPDPGFAVGNLPPEAR